MFAANKNLALPVTFQESDFYRTGDPISWWLDENPFTQHSKTAILNSLATGIYDAQTRIDIGDHKNTPLEVHLVLAADEDADVRFALAENHNIDECVLNVLAEDSHPYVAYRAQKTLANLKRLAAGANRLPDVLGFPRCASTNMLGRKLIRAVL